MEVINLCHNCILADSGFKIAPFLITCHQLLLHNRLIAKLKFLGRKRENPSPFKEIGGFVV